MLSAAKICDGEDEEIAVIKRDICNTFQILQFFFRKKWWGTNRTRYPSSRCPNHRIHRGRLLRAQHPIGFIKRKLWRLNIISQTASGPVWSLPTLPCKPPGDLSVENRTERKGIYKRIWNSHANASFGQKSFCVLYAEDSTTTFLCAICVHNICGDLMQQWYCMYGKD